MASGPMVAIAPADEPRTTGSSSSKKASSRYGNASLLPIKLSVLADARLTITFWCWRSALQRMGSASSPTAPRLFAKVSLKAPLASPSPATIRSSDSASDLGSSPSLNFALSSLASWRASSSVSWLSLIDEISVKSWSTVDVQLR